MYLMLNSPLFNRGSVLDLFYDLFVRITMSREIRFAIFDCRRNVCKDNRLIVKR